MTIAEHASRRRIPPAPSQAADAGLGVLVSGGFEAQTCLRLLPIEVGRWSVLDPARSDDPELGMIVEISDLFEARHADNAPPYCFHDFGQALSYFMEYAVILRDDRFSTD